MKKSKEFVLLGAVSTEVQLARFASEGNSLLVRVAGIALEVIATLRVLEHPFLLFELMKWVLMELVCLSFLNWRSSDCKFLMAGYAEVVGAGSARVGKILSSDCARAALIADVTSSIRAVCCNSVCEGGLLAGVLMCSMRLRRALPQIVHRFVAEEEGHVADSRCSLHGLVHDLSGKGLDLVDRLQDLVRRRSMLLLLLEQLE
mmetsp:Transcript_17081/g.12231  ORF Transcript_17081/g.12231 Transcript_17081/m.12231 type:complete len:203 (-) Transcript_17081:186-794(-)